MNGFKSWGRRFARFLSSGRKSGLWQKLREIMWTFFFVNEKSFGHTFSFFKLSLDILRTLLVLFASPAILVQQSIDNLAHAASWFSSLALARKSLQIFKIKPDFRIYNWINFLWVNQNSHIWSYQIERSLFDFGNWVTT